ncbi:putative amidinotransferase [Actinoplanes missouriensis 431]|uniref:Putative amidinotransferase n=1 Tax=Actinoplanes missouriensis (strain ATCC 14538 / DSM 43046 / CBS 188.64 / JCM 3121 / NBRC 102363 / NCIMB 12654 / NRRL B-3342 / UNCC 431) TaxID=512565 RepID=I0HJT9_ACTM4|nr:dimethylargininase [Actinoplanes missouriensis]BAL93276.1 putative amidinotransferase [Actinoplanes missouriensis 431]
MSHDERLPRNRTYLMCPPEHFTVEYAINPWMDTKVAVDAGRALTQWEMLRTTLTGLGHQVHVLDARPGLPDMVYSANGAFSVDGTVYGARFKYPQRAAEAAAHQAFYTSSFAWRYVEPQQVNEGEGDFAYLPGAYGGLVLAGYGFRTDPAAHAEAQEVLGRPVISLKLVDPAFYHLDTALAALDDRHVTYYPDAFSPASQRVLAQLFPDALLADREDAEAFGLNLVSDGRHVILNTEATGMARKVSAAGYLPMPVDLSELKRGGGSVKCAVAELRA